MVPEAGEAVLAVLFAWYYFVRQDETSILLGQSSKCRCNSHQSLALSLKSYSKYKQQLQHLHFRPGAKLTNLGNNRQRSPFALCTVHEIVAAVHPLTQMIRPSATATRAATVSQGRALSRPRLALIGSPRLAYLRGLISAASIRQGFDVDLFAGSFADYQDLLSNPESELGSFRPDVLLVTVEADIPGLP